MKFDNKSVAKENCSAFKKGLKSLDSKLKVNCPGKSITVKKYAKIMTNDQNESMVGTTYDNYISSMINSGYKCD